MPNDTPSPPPADPQPEQSRGLIGALLVTEAVLVAWLFWDTFDLQRTRVFLRERLEWTLGGAAVLVAVAWAGVRLLVQWRLVRSSRARAALTLFGLIPVLVLIGLLISTLTFNNYVAAFRAFFILFACLFPVALYYMFVVSRKHSLLNEYLTCLARLGLLQPRRLTPLSGNDPAQQEDRAAWRRRMITYLQRFEAVYGPIPADVRRQIGRTTADTEQLAKIIADVDWGHEDGGDTALALARETRAPLVHATLLLVLGWLLVLPPWVPQLGNPAVAPERSTKGAAIAPAPVASERFQASSPPPAAPPDTVRERAQETAKGAAKAIPDVLSPTGSAPLFAFLGAYFFMVQLLFQRSMRRDLRANVYMTVSLRIIIAVVGAWALQAALEWMFESPDQRLLNVTAFAMGAFPPLLWQVLAAAFKRSGSWALPSLSARMPISDLDGVSVWHQARLEEEDIENIPNMATADLADLMLSTRLPPERIVDWVDQAILYTQLGPVPESGGGLRGALQACGLRAASGIIEANAYPAESEKRLALQQVLGDHAASFRVLAGALATNPNLDLVLAWRGL